MRPRLSYALKRREHSMKIEVVPYRPEWPDMFQEEKEKIEGILGSGLTAVHHIGSTAVPGLSAKPILDIMPVVADIAGADLRVQQFEEQGYEYMGEFGIPGRRYLRKERNGIRTHHIHIFGVESQRDIRRHLAVRDYLRAHAAAAKAYGALKRRLARQFPEDLEAYCDGKDAFVKQLERDALDWAERTQEGNTDDLGGGL